MEIGRERERGEGQRKLNAGPRSPKFIPQPVDYVQAYKASSSATWQRFD